MYIDIHTPRGRAPCALPRPFGFCLATVARLPNIAASQTSGLAATTTYQIDPVMHSVPQSSPPPLPPPLSLQSQQLSALTLISALCLHENLVNNLYNEGKDDERTGEWACGPQTHPSIMFAMLVVLVAVVVAALIFNSFFLLPALFVFTIG